MTQLAAIDANIRVLNSVEKQWGLPALPAVAKVDIASLIGDTNTVRSFTNEIYRGINLQMAKEPDPESIVQVQAVDRAAGAISMGLDVPSGARRGQPGLWSPGQGRAQGPTAVPQLDHDPMNLSVPTGFSVGGLKPEIGLPNFRGDFGHLASGLTGTTNLMGERMWRVKDQNAVKVLKAQAIQMGLVDPTTPIDGTWSSEWNGIMSRMAQEDFQRQIQGTRPGATSVEKLTTLADEWLSPSFLAGVSGSVTLDMLSDYAIIPGDVGREFTNWSAKWDKSARVWSNSNASVGDKTGALIDALTGPIDDIVVPLLNIALLFTGVSEVMTMARAVQLTSKTAHALKGGSRMGKFLKAAPDAATSQLLANASMQTTEAVSAGFVKRYAKMFVPGNYGQADAMVEMGEWMRKGKLLGKMPGATQNTVGAWRALKPVMVAKKVNQQVWRMGQFNMMNAASGMNNQAARATENMKDYRAENPTAFYVADVLTGVDFFLTPRNIYPLDTALGVGGQLNAARKTTEAARKFMHETGWATETAEGIAIDLDKQGHMGADVFRSQWKTKGAPHAIKLYMSGSLERFRSSAPTSRQVKRLEANDYGSRMAQNFITHSVFSMAVQVQAKNAYDEAIRAGATVAQASKAMKNTRQRWIAQASTFEPNDVQTFLHSMEIMDGANSVTYKRYAAVLDDPTQGGFEAWDFARDEVQRLIRMHNEKSVGMRHQLLEGFHPGEGYLTEYLTSTAFNPGNVDSWRPFWHSWEELGDLQTSGMLNDAEFISDWAVVEQQIGAKFPLSELLAPGGDPVIRQKVLGILGDGSLPDSGAHRDNTMLQYLGRAPNQEGSHRFGLARMDSVSKNQMLVFLSGVKTLMKQRDVIERFIASPKAAGELGQIVAAATKQGVSMKNMKATDWLPFITSVMGKGVPFSKGLDDDAVRYLARFLEGKQGFNAHMVLKEMDDILTQVADSEVWSSIFKLNPNVKSGAGKTGVERLKGRLAEGKAIAQQTAAEVTSKNPAVMEFQAELAQRGYKLVHGQEFFSPAAIVDRFPEMRMMSAEDYFNSVGGFKPKVWMKKMGNRHMGWALQPGEKLHRNLYDQNMRNKVAIQMYRAGIRNIDLDPEGDDIGHIVDSMMKYLRGIQTTHQDALDNASGALNRAGSRISHSTAPRSLNSLFWNKSFYGPDGVRWTKDGADVPMLDHLGKSGMKALKKAMVESEWLGDLNKPSYQLYPGGPTVVQGRSNVVLNSRGPLLGLQDWFNSHGAARGTVLGGMALLSRTSASTKAMHTGGKYKTTGIMAGVAGAMVGGIAGHNLDDEEMGSLAGVGLSKGFAAGALMGGAGMAGASATGVSEALGGVAKGQKFRPTSKVGAAMAGGFAGGVMAEDEELGAPLGALVGTIGGTAALNRMRSSRAATTHLSSYNTLPHVLTNLGMALRFSLSPLFDMQRYTEGASLSWIEDLRIIDPKTGVLTLEEAKIPVLAKSRKRWRREQRKAGMSSDETSQAWDDLKGEFDRAGKTATGEESGLEVVEQSVRRFQEEGLMGWSPMERMVTTYDELVKTGMGSKQAYEKSRKIFTYGVQGRTTGELTINALFFPFSFQARFVGRWAQYLTDDTTRAVMVHDALRTYDLLNENFNLSEKLKEHVPLIRDLQKINALAYGVSLGEFGGINRPFVDLFVPLGVYVTKSASGVISGKSVNESMQEAGDVAEVDMGQLASRILPAVRDITALVDSLEEQGHVIFGENHLTRAAESDRAWAQWRSVQEKYDTVARTYGFKDWTAFQKSRPAATQGWGQARNADKAAIADQFPVWEQSIADGASRKFLADRILARRASVGVEKVDDDIRQFVAFMDVTMENDATARDYSLDDQSTMPPDAFDRIRRQALMLSGHGNGFEKIWDSHYRKVFGPIERSQWISMPTTGLRLGSDSLDASPLGLGR